MQREEIIMYTAVSMYGDSGEFITGSAWLLCRHVANVLHTGARICKLFREPNNRFPAWRAGTTTLFDVDVPSGYIGWRNRSLGIDSWAP